MAVITWIHKWILFLFAIGSVGADIFPTRKFTNVSLALPKSLPYEDLVAHIPYYERCGDTVFNIAHSYCGKNWAGMLEVKSCSNLCGDPNYDLKCVEKCPTHRECMLGLSGQNEELCAKFFIFTLHEDVSRMNASNTTTPDPQTTTSIPKADRDTELECPAPKDCTPDPSDCDKVCPKSTHIPEATASAKVVEYDGATDAPTVSDSNHATKKDLSEYRYFRYAIICLLAPANVGLILYGLIRLFRRLFNKGNGRNNGVNSNEENKKDEEMALNSGENNNDAFDQSTPGARESTV